MMVSIEICQLRPRDTEEKLQLCRKEGSKRQERQPGVKRS
jgi:hypothetical protein